MPLEAGRKLGHFKILGLIGAGGMGEVYKARDERLDRLVAIKVLRSEALGNPLRHRRFVQEAKAASALNHPGIVTIYEIDRALVGDKEIDFIVMEFLEGRPLDAGLKENPASVERAVSYAVQIADALVAAHALEIVHRDLKPANAMVSESGRVKIVDFGLAKLLEPDSDEIDESAPTKSRLQTEEGLVLGTASYMSPEQAEGKPVDARSDIFSLGAVVYELLTGQRAFQGDSNISMRMAILTQTPPSLKSLQPRVPGELERIVFRCLEKNRAARYQTARELLDDLTRFQHRLSADGGISALLRKPHIALGAATVVLALSSIGAWSWWRSSSATWAVDTALPEIGQLRSRQQNVAAFRLALEALPHLDNPKDVLRTRQSFYPFSVKTTPSGASVYFNDYLNPETEWTYLGDTPVEDLYIPFAFYRYRIELEGFGPVERASGVWPAPGGTVLDIELTPLDETPPEMVRVSGGSFRYGALDPVELDDFWLDRHEVTNAKFKKFVDAGGYETRTFWKHPFVKDGRELDWEEAMKEFRDPTGRAGPSTWEVGAFAPELAEHPVRGISWYEAAAYADFAGKSLPTLFHWHKAAGGYGIFSETVRGSNFGGKEPTPTGRIDGLNRYGSYDMAGNVKEWSSTRAGEFSYVLGGAWDEPSYVFLEGELRSPFLRDENIGLRCARYDAPPSAELTADVHATVFRDFREEKPVEDEVFAAFLRMFSYDPTPLEANLETRDDSHDFWIEERVSFNAAYGTERMLAYLFLPRNAEPPYQTVVYFPGSNAWQMESYDWQGTHWFDFVMRSGRALLYPVYKGSYERRDDVDITKPSSRRDQVIQWSKDLQRSLDYLETRDDFDPERVAYYGLSRGAYWAPVMAAIETRIKAVIMAGGAFAQIEWPPEIEPFNFAPRCKAPTLMVNGRYDFVLPLEAAQRPTLRLLGAPDEDKRLVLTESGHIPTRQVVIKETLNWLDRYLGPVTRSR